MRRTTAGALVVGEVDLIGASTVRSYRAGESLPLVFSRGETAHAERAVPGWRFRVDDLFE